MNNNSNLIIYIVGGIILIHFLVGFIYLFILQNE